MSAGPSRTFHSGSLADRPDWWPERPAGLTVTDRATGRERTVSMADARTADLSGPEAGYLFATDKAYWHGYLPAYQWIASQIAGAGRVCEIGVWAGDSLKMWQVLFPGGLVAGVDHDPGSVWPPGTIRVVASQDDENLPAALREVSPGGFDLIVDDASHDGALTRRTRELLWPLVAPGGFYVIEDWQKGMGIGGGEKWRAEWLAGDDSMLRAAESFLPLLDSRDCDPDSIEYRYGLVIMHKRVL